LRALHSLRRGETAEQVFFRRNEAFQRAIPDDWIEDATHVVGFDTSSWLLAGRANKIGRPFFLDQSIGHPMAKERVYAELRLRFPEWAETVPMKTTEHLASEKIEHELATLIVAPSGFVRRTLAEEGVEEEKIHVIPFGTDLSLFFPAKAVPVGPVIFLFVGSLSARKGVPVLLKAWQEAKLAGRAELWLAGSGRLPLSAAAASDGVRWLGPLSRTQLADTMRRAHTLVCPSFFEGLAQVQVEALATGLPVIGTTASGADEVVVPGETGWVLVPGDIAALAAALGDVAGDATGRERMRARCVELRECLGWAIYGQRWLGLLAALRVG
jgi:glycosyltransferase involved in cell wall biosynthesis